MDNSSERMMVIPKEGTVIDLFCYICKEVREHHVKSPSAIGNGTVTFQSKCTCCEIVLPFVPVKVEKCGKLIEMKQEQYGLTRLSLDEWNYRVGERVFAS